ncbi:MULTISPECIES: hypothetical protein [Streptomyces]|uniref:Uncharacterized protein n=2 Tax=Streptomyces TaxID=1883 RepID=A0A939JT06_9ACTN|nr:MULTISPECIES: hypothetical protein [Streptomyces]MBO0655229.1 hypothetical protein [Streptomyces triculaminicus]QSY50915.1 hypothetical protein J3S04_08395 [Streptomyces griseocarneus]
MKTTMPSRKTANPRRTTLAHLKDATALLGASVERPEHAVELPGATANPRRTVLMVAPQTQLPQD